MWLLNASDYRLIEFLTVATAPPYAILSHVWVGDEVLFRDLADLSVAKGKKGWVKVDYTCQQARKDGLQWVWIDSCCIDKSSSAELSEAINSMYNWYAMSSVCYVYLSDFASTATVRDDATDAETLAAKDELRMCRWWTRGWTLQELLAPRTLCFYSKSWTEVGHLFSLTATVSEITGIEMNVLLGIKPLRDVCGATKMSWAAHRQTTRPEDEAYCLLGIFDINMPLLYGEGRRAFARLLEEIMRASSDLSLLAWEFDKPVDATDNSGLYATTPTAFARWNRGLQTLKYHQSTPVQVTNADLIIASRLTSFQNGHSLRDGELVAIDIGVSFADATESHVCLIATKRPAGTNVPGTFEYHMDPYAQHADGATMLDRRTSYRRLAILDRASFPETLERRVITIRKAAFMIAGRPRPRGPTYATQRDLVVRCDPECGLKFIDALPRDKWNLTTGHLCWRLVETTDLGAPVNLSAALLLKNAHGELEPLVLYRDIRKLPNGGRTEQIQARFLPGVNLDKAYSMSQGGSRKDTTTLTRHRDLWRDSGSLPGKSHGFADSIRIKEVRQKRGVSCVVLRLAPRRWPAEIGATTGYFSNVDSIDSHDSE